MGFAAVAGMAQVSNTLSPYSQFGLGALADQSQSFSRGMGGIGMGLRGGQLVNMQNPASYSAVDSLTMMFDCGVTGQTTNFKEGGKKVNANTADFDYAVALFRVMPKMGVSVGFVPYTNVGYSYSVESYAQDAQTGAVNKDNKGTYSYTGTGGLSQAYVGIGYEVLRGLSIGANLSYLWGNYTKSTIVTNSDSYASIMTQSYKTTVSSYKIDLGAQWQHRLDKNNLLTLGATIGIGHKLGADAEFVRSNTSESQADTSKVVNAFSVPFSFGVGGTLLHKNNLTVGLDYTFQKWGSLDYPRIDAGSSSYVLMGGLLSDRHKVAVGADWIPSAMSRRYYNRVHYRAGMYYSTPYYKINGSSGPSEFGVSAGVGLPITNSWNNRSVLNVSAQWVRCSQSSFITENTFRINIGLTFNERWFAKWKVD